LLNLIGNAIKFSPEHDSIKVYLMTKPQADDTVVVTIKVIDFGIGISKDDQKRLFSAYFRTTD